MLRTPPGTAAARRVGSLETRRASAQGRDEKKNQDT